MLPPRLKLLLKRSPIRPLLQRRRFHAYCLGAPKTGTTSISMMLRRHYRAEHEPLGAGTLELVQAALRDGAAQDDIEARLRRRDRELYLEMESSHPMTVLAGPLAAAFPAARFVLVYREPRAWLDSIINMRLERAVHRFDRTPRPDNIFWLVNEYFYRSRYPVHPPEERLLETLGLYTLDGYLSGWARHHALVLDNVPPDRLLVVEVSDLTRHPERLARFLGVAPESLDRSAGHANRATGNHAVLDQLDPALIEARIEQHCGALSATLQRLRQEWAGRFDRDG